MRRVATILLAGLLGGLMGGDSSKCTTHTIYINGRYIVCYTCCSSEFCNTTCS